MRWAPGIATALLGAGLATADAPEWRVLGADLVEKTDRYGHDVLGGNEYAAMRVDYLYAGDVVQTVTISLPEDRVFEDVEARIADLHPSRTGPRQAPEHIVVVEASLSGGAELAVYGLADGTVQRIAATPPIGRRNRWLAVAGIADFDGDGQNDIAYVETPHIGGTLRIWTLRGGRLVEIARARGFSNHRIGEPFITGGVRWCGAGPELVLPNFNWTKTMLVRLEGGAIAVRELANAADHATIDVMLQCG